MIRPSQLFTEDRVQTLVHLMDSEKLSFRYAFRTVFKLNPSVELLHHAKNIPAIAGVIQRRDEYIRNKKSFR